MPEKLTVRNSFVPTLYQSAWGAVILQVAGVISFVLGFAYRSTDWAKYATGASFAFFLVGIIWLLLAYRFRSQLISEGNFEPEHTFFAELFYGTPELDFIPKEINKVAMPSSLISQKQEVVADIPPKDTIAEPSANEEKEKPANDILPKIEPETLFDLFGNDFETGSVQKEHDIIVTDNATKLATTIGIVMKLLTDFNARSNFVAFYIPETLVTFGVCKYLADRYVIAFSMKDDAVIESGFWDERLTSLKELQFTGRIFIYYEGYLTTEQKEFLVELYKQKSLSLILRGSDYSFNRNHPRKYN